MSGGHFGYSYHNIDDVALEIAEVIYKNKQNKEFSKKTIAEFNEAIRALRVASVFVQRIDWLLSDDDGEESFHERLKQDLSEIK